MKTNKKVVAEWGFSEDDGTSGYRLITSETSCVLERRYFDGLGDPCWKSVDTNNEKADSMHLLARELHDGKLMLVKTKYVTEDKDWETKTERDF